MTKAQSSLGLVYGWKRSLPIFNDTRFSLGKHVPLPRHVDIHEKLPAIWNQGKQGSCTAHGNGAAYCAARKIAGQQVFMPSRAFIYYCEREEEGTIEHDVGATISDGVMVMKKWGVPPESVCPYDPDKLMTQKPSPAVYAEAEKHQTLTSDYVSHDTYALQQCLAQGWPIVFGFTVYQNFEDDAVIKTGLMEMPRGAAIGGHCVVACGYNSHNYFMCRNSYGTDFGDPDFPGHFWIPPSYITNRQLAADFRVIKTVED